MDKIKLLTIAVISLLILNVGTLGFLILKDSPEPHRPKGMHGGPKNIIVERLQFDTKQQQKYGELIQWHRSTIRETEDKIHDAKNNLYQQLKESNVDLVKKDSLIAVLAQYQKEIENTHFNHFRDIKMLCKPEQLNAYKDLTEELSRLFSKPKGPRHER